MEPSQEFKDKIIFLSDKLEEAVYIKDKVERQNKIISLKNI